MSGFSLTTRRFARQCIFLTLSAFVFGGVATIPPARAFVVAFLLAPTVIRTRLAFIAHSVTACLRLGATGLKAE